jgi:hypothetical protein
MPSQSKLFSRKPRRTKPGFGIVLVIIGWFLKVIGMLLVGVAIVGFSIMLVKLGPELVRALEYSSEGEFAGFVFLLYLTYLLIFPLFGLVGVILAGISFLFNLWGTEPTVTDVNAGLISNSTLQAQEQGTKDPG